MANKFDFQPDNKFDFVEDTPNNKFDFQPDNIHTEMFMLLIKIY